MTILPDGTLCSSSKDKTVRTWDVEAHQPKEVIPFHNKNLNAMCTMPDGKLAVAVENLIKFYNVQKEEIEKTLTGHVKPIMCLCPTPEGNLLSGGQDQVIKYWNVKTGQLIKTFYGHDDFVRAIRLTQDGKSFVKLNENLRYQLPMTNP
jgi:WD40 repeat protein